MSYMNRRIILLSNGLVSLTAGLEQNDSDCSNHEFSLLEYITSCKPEIFF